MMREVDTVILCGGEGKRLQKVVGDRPKPMAQINEQPFMDTLINYAAAYGANRFILCAGFMADYINDYYRNKHKSFELLLSVENTPLGTAGAIKNAEKLIRSSPFLVMNGDSYCPVNLDVFVDFHKSKKALVSMVVSETENADDFGSVILDEAKKVIRFQEKKSQDKSFINSGIYLFEREVLSMLPQNIKYSLEFDFFSNLVGQRFYGFVSSDRLIDIGTPQRYEQAKKFFKK